jgi:hypothetical protein
MTLGMSGPHLGVELLTVVDGVEDARAEAAAVLPGRVGVFVIPEWNLVVEPDEEVVAAVQAVGVDPAGGSGEGDCLDGECH